MTPTEILLNKVQWTKVAVDKGNTGTGMPYVTHQGTLKLDDVELRCYQLNDGRRIFDAEDIERLFGLVPNA